MSSNSRKGEERPRSLLDDLALLVQIASLGLNYLVVGRRIRKRFRELQRAGEKFYVDDAAPPRPRG